MSYIKYVHRVEYYYILNMNPKPNFKQRSFLAHSKCSIYFFISIIDQLYV